MAIKEINALDLFAGAGGFSLGLEESGINVVAAVEFDKKIAKTYKHNHQHTKIYNTDIRQIAANAHDASTREYSENATIEDAFSTIGKSVDLIFGGPPCQGFSMAGRRIRTDKPFFEDERNLLFLEFLRMVTYLNPKVFIIENVPGMLNYDNGRIKREVEERFSSLGYDVKSKVLSAEKFGVPQKRKRAIFIGNNLGIDSETLFPEETNNEEDYVTVWDAISDLPSLKSGEGIEPCTYTKDPQSRYQLLMRNTKDDLFYNHISSIHKEKTIEILKLIKPGQTMKDLPENMRTKSVHSGAYGRMVKNEPSYTLTTRLNTPSVGRITHPVDDRTITPREAARIQSFPDNYHFIGDITTVGIQIGNSVPPLLGKAIGESIISKAFTMNATPLTAIY
ncbi:DNA cytosine methyltransferase [Enterococcus hirae]|uniref:DNA cytosine methyltransferase n=1 Tax=Enterococcus TaxID=1350 RepID=UPI001880C083|nr:MULTISPECIES: DNA cytosine methyltransferase [Enterococcus]MBE8867636.1 DNA cytosine methyltransferase [Enterococcus hirae]MDT2665556.1 DNA cytosine methyltransferase [Enterococcus hirae]MDV7722027.1 DNA cytosine methyltransferase [Enterococcus faecium]MDW3666437.1 DNA cytosine methyltransferase [Enterococcus hirae]UYT93171.1 DNA cytosine methyltransferase [Enterococcus hirae]